MTYALSSALQSAVYQCLVADAPLDQLVAGAIYDALPSGTLSALYVSLGPEKVRDLSDKTAAGAEHEFVVSVVTDQTGFSAAKAAAGAVCDALIGASLVLQRGQLTALNFHRADAVRNGDQRRIDLKFKARLSDQ